MALCQYTAVREDGAQAWEREDVTPGVCTLDQFWELYFATDSKMYYNVAWNKLYSRKLFDSCRYPVGKISEDAFVLYDLVSSCKHIALSDEAKYYYRIRSASIMSSKSSLKHLDTAEAYLNRAKRFAEAGQWSFAETMLLSARSEMVLKEYGENGKNSAVYRDLDNQVRLFYQEIRPYMSFLVRIVLSLSLRFAPLTFILVRVYAKSSRLLRWSKTSNQRKAVSPRAGATQRESWNRSMKQNKVLNNVAYNIAYQVLILIVPFITAPYVSRVLHAEGLGTYSVTTAIAKYFWMFGLLGIGNYGNRRIASIRVDKQKLSREFSNLYYFQLTFSTLATLLFLAYVFAFGHSHYGIVIICQLPYLLAAVFEVSWFFSGTEQFRFMVIKNSVIKIATTAAVFLFVKSEQDVWVYVLINALSLLAGQLVLWPFLLRQVRFTKPEFNVMKRHLKPNLVLMVSVVAVSIYVMMDKIMIEWLSSNVHVGYYENTEKILNMTTGIVGAIGTVMLPRMTYLNSSGETNQTMNFLSKSIRYIMTFAIAIGFGVAGIAREFSVIYYGEDFAICGTSIAIIALALLFYSWENILKTQYLLPNMKDKIFVGGTIAAAICNLVLNYLLIPRYGVIGAVVSTVSAQAAAATYESISIRKELPIRQYIAELLPVGFIGAIMYFVCRAVGLAIGFKWYGILVQIAVGAAVFTALAFLHFSRINDEVVVMVKDKLRGRK